MNFDLEDMLAIDEFLEMMYNKKCPNGDEKQALELIDAIAEEMGYCLEDWDIVREQED